MDHQEIDRVRSLEQELTLLNGQLTSLIGQLRADGAPTNIIAGHRENIDQNNQRIAKERKAVGLVYAVVEVKKNVQTGKMDESVIRAHDVRKAADDQVTSLAANVRPGELEYKVMDAVPRDYDLFDIVA